MTDLAVGNTGHYIANRLPVDASDIVRMEVSFTGTIQFVQVVLLICLPYGGLGHQKCEGNS